MEETISLEELFSILKKRLLLIFVCMLAGVAIAGGITFLLITPRYSSSAQLVVQSQNDQNTNLQADINGNVLMINTYKDMIMGNLVISATQEQLTKEKGYILSDSDVKDMLSVEQSTNSQMFKIIATSENPQEAADVANTAAEIFKNKVGEVLNVNKVTIISNASKPASPISPNNKLNLAIGLVIGVMIGVGLAFLFEFLDKTVKDERFITSDLGLPILGAVEEVSNKELNAGFSLQLRKVTLSSAREEKEAPATEKTEEQPISRRSRSRV